MLEEENIIKKFPVILFDDTCLLCNRAVQFILKREKGIPFYFIALQSTALKNQPGLNGYSKKSESLILLYHGKVFLYFDAVLKIARLMGFPWNLATIFYLIPQMVRNRIYRWIALHRYQWFGKANACMTFAGKFRGRLLDGTIIHNHPVQIS